MKAKKSLGQNFLESEEILESIVGHSDINQNEIILEIGPGKGALTKHLLKVASKVIAIEKDKDLIPILKKKFAKEIGEGKFELIEKDILEFDPELLSSYKKHDYKVVANIPYYITGKIVPLFLTSKTQPTDMILMVQKEVAERIIAKDGKESLLSLSVKAYGNPEYLMTVGRENFNPKPLVDSALIKISHISRDFFENEAEERAFFRMIKMGFSSKRKKLLNNLKPWKEDVRERFSRCGIDMDIRAEKIPLGSWKCLLK